MAKNLYLIKHFCYYCFNHFIRAYSVPMVQKSIEPNVNTLCYLVIFDSIMYFLKIPHKGGLPT